MNISISATNPCHLYDLARALHAQHALGRYYSGYPRWKLRPPANFPLTTRSARTLLTYGTLRLPTTLRPAPHRLFRWQDAGFDRSVADALEGDPAQSLHAMPGQALATFRAARHHGITPVLNHASGPVRQQLALVREEYRRAGVEPARHHGFDAAYFARENEEYALAGYHCVASNIVRRQLVADGVPSDRIWVVPYGADTETFYPPEKSGGRDGTKIVFAGQLSLRKGLRIAFPAVEHARRHAPFHFHLYGPTSSEIRSTLAPWTAASWVHLHGPAPQKQLAEVFRSAAMLVLPSFEEAFGLVIVQALNCGLPCIVSDRVGAGDLIEHRRNGSIVPAGDSSALAEEILWWSEHPDAFNYRPFDWHGPARQLLHLSPSTPCQ